MFLNNNNNQRAAYILDPTPPARSRTKCYISNRFAELFITLQFVLHQSDEKGHLPKWEKDRAERKREWEREEINI